MIARFAPIFLAALGLASIPSAALAQGNTFNPYGNSGYADYREFGTPMLSNNLALPGQAVLNHTPIVGRPRANSFQDYTNDIDGIDSPSTGGRRGAGNSVPYYQAYQRLNSEYNRVYKPNAKADEGFYERQKAREQKYAQAMVERDPAKRAKLLREVERDTLTGLSGSKPSTKGATTRPKAKAATNGTTPSARSTAPTERRMQAPSPFSDNRPLSRSTAPPSGRSSAGTTSRAATNAARARAESRATEAPGATTAPVPPPR